MMREGEGKVDPLQSPNIPGERRHEDPLQRELRDIIPTPQRARSPVRAHVQESAGDSIPISRPGRKRGQHIPWHSPDEQRISVELALLAQKGDRRAADRFIGRYEAMCYNLGYQFRAPGADVEEVAHWARLGVWDAMERYCPERGVPIGAWVFYCARLRVYSGIKLARRSKHELLNGAVPLVVWDDEEGEWRHHDVAAESAQSALFRRSAPELLLRARERLSAMEWAVALAWLDDLSYQEIAERVGIHLKGVDNAWRRAQRKLRQVAEEMEW